MALTDDTVLELVGRLDGLLAELEALDESPERALALDAVNALVTLYGEGFARIVGHLSSSGGVLPDAFVRDDLISHLLVLHDLHPEPVEQRVQRALEDVRPYLQSHGGNVEFAAIDGDRARLRMQGSCAGCPSSTETLRSRIEEAVLTAAPELSAVVAEPMEPEAPDIAAATALVSLHRAPARAPRTHEHGAPCELCGQAVYPEHRHLFDLEHGRMLCVCRPCSVLFDRGSAGGNHYRLIPDRYRPMDPRVFDDGAWERFGFPVDIAYFHYSSAAGHVQAFYPGPMGATESQLELSAWSELVDQCPELATLEPDVEALLVDRAHGAREHWLVPVDACYRLVGVIRTNWRGLGGGEEVWEKIDAFFADVRQRAGLDSPIAPSSRELLETT